MEPPTPKDAGFVGRIETELVGPDLYRAVSVMDVREDGEEDIVRVPLAGEHPSRCEAEVAARLAIEATTRAPRDSR